MVLIIGIIFLLLAFSNPGHVSEQMYVVKQGDTLSEIAEEYDLEWRYLADYNDIDNPNQIREGVRLRIPEKKYIISYTEEEYDFLARLIHAEARGESLEGQIAVGAVVINRVLSEKFPNSIMEVIHQSGQFTPIGSGSLPDIADDNAVEAAQRALSGVDPTDGALFFYNPSTTAIPEYWQTRPVIKQIGNHNFSI